MIGIYNRGSKRIKNTFIENIVDCPERELKVRKNLSKLQKYNITIAHASNEDWQQLITEYSSRGNVRVRVTVDGTPFNVPPTNRNGIYTFHLVTSARDLVGLEWKEILSGLSKPEVLKGLVRGENPNSLRRFFVHEVQEHLSALTILCEGYLAVHAENTDCSEDISSALQLMGWAEFQKSDRYSALIREDLSEQISIVQRRQWWSDVFEPESFDNDVKKEWENTTGTEEIPTALNDLLEAIRNGNTIVPPKIVADAYCVLVKKK